MLVSSIHPPHHTPTLILAPQLTPLAEESRKHLYTTVTTLGAQIDSDLRSRITTIHQNAQSLESQSRTVQSRTAALSKTTKQWSGVAEGARSRLKEIGDIQNWAEMIEHDLMVIEETLNIVYGEEEEGGGLILGEERGHHHTTQVTAST